MLNNDSTSQEGGFELGFRKFRALKRYRSGACPVIQNRFAGGAKLVLIFCLGPFSLDACERNDLSNGFEVATTDFFT